jgi:Tfp pilus assembly protein PilX
MSEGHQRRGLRLPDVLVLVVLGLLALLLAKPILELTRHEAQQIRRRSNAGQQGEALLRYHQMHRAFPMQRTPQGRSQE